MAETAEEADADEQREESNRLRGKVNTNGIQALRCHFDPINAAKIIPVAAVS